MRDTRRVVQQASGLGVVLRAAVCLERLSLREPRTPVGGYCLCAMPARAFALHPDGVQEAEGATLRGWALEPLPFDGRKLGSAFALVRLLIPEFTIFGGMMVDRTDSGHLPKLTQSESPSAARR